MSDVQELKVTVAKESDGRSIHLRDLVSFWYLAGRTKESLDEAGSDDVLEDRFEGEPTVVELGSGSLLPGLEAAISGHEVGSTLEVQVRGELAAQIYAAKGSQGDELWLNIYIDSVWAPSSFISSAEIFDRWGMVEQDAEWEQASHLQQPHLSTRVLVLLNDLDQAVARALQSLADAVRAVPGVDDQRLVESRDRLRAAQEALALIREDLSEMHEVGADSVQWLSEVIDHLTSMKADLQLS
jgi:hypothetical protein